MNINIIGRVTADAKVSTTKGGKKVVNFDVAVNDYYKKKDSTEPVKITEYYRCSYWLNSEVADKLKKGVLVELHGRIGLETYINKRGEAAGTFTLNANKYKVHTSIPKGQREFNDYVPMTGHGEYQGASDLPF